MRPRQAQYSRSHSSLNGNMSWTDTPVVLSCMLLSVLAAEQRGFVPGKGPQGPLEQLGLEEVGLGPVGRSELGDKPSCLQQGRWENVNKSLIRPIVFIPFSSQLNDLLPSLRAFYLKRGREKKWKGWGCERFNSPYRKIKINSLDSSLVEANSPECDVLL